MPSKGCCSWTNLHPGLEDKIKPYFRIRYWLGAAFLPTFLAVEKSLVDVSRKADLPSKANLKHFNAN